MTNFLSTNWLWIVALIAFVAMHRSGHGCGMHGGHRSHGSDRNHSSHGNDSESGSTQTPNPRQDDRDGSRR